PAVENPSAYIFRIAANQYQQKLRKDLAEQKALGGYKNSVQHSADTTLNSYHSKQIRQLVQEAVSKLPAQRRKIFLMSRRDGLTFREIATQLNISPKTVKNTVFAALTDIRAHLTATGESAWCWMIVLIWL
ncbi:MAG: sigma-70 family RNA polymerase sigma factor, partial [Chitinophagaceae bacterium]|nr:sigma-70 family RNA polymerase sigma factor [Chitinophagaceae bacterium]